MKRNTKTYRLTIGAMMLAFGVILPQIFHLTGIPQVGSVFLPMHIPVLLSGFLCGPIYGVFIGAASPIISHFLLHMPDATRLPFMVVELMFYGLITGVLFHRCNFKSKKFGIIISLIGAMISGRAVNAAMIFVLLKCFNVAAASQFSVVTQTVTGVYGIVLQLLIIPPVIYAARKGGLVYESHSKGKAKSSK